MQDILIVVDMQNDFITGALGTKEAVEIVPRVEEKIKTFNGRVIFTRDTHFENYMNTQEGRKLPVLHCVKGTDGWQICSQLAPLCNEPPVDKPTFGSSALGEMLCAANQRDGINSITLVGLCTDICVISNALLIKAFLPEVELRVDASCCAGVTPESHTNALSAMRSCQIVIENE